MFFDDIFNKAKELWTQDFFINHVDQSERRSDELISFYHSVEDFFYEKGEENGDLLDLVTWSTFTTLSVAIKKSPNHVDKMGLNDISIQEIERNFRRNLDDASWENYRVLYEGFKMS